MLARISFSNVLAVFIATTFPDEMTVAPRDCIKDINSLVVIYSLPRPAEKNADCDNLSDAAFPPVPPVARFVDI